MSAFTRRFHKRHFGTSASTMAIVAGMFAASSAYADDVQQVETITVTAQRTSQSLQKTAASVAALSPEDLQNAGVQGLDDISHLIPGLTFTTGFNPNGLQITLRGLPTPSHGEPPIAYVVDGAEAPAPDFINQALLDIDNVQVLRGPQGGIYGRNAIGGAVIIETQKPTDEFSDTLKVDGGNGDEFRAFNTASGALIPDKLWAKLTLEDHYFGGLIINQNDGKPADSIREAAGRFELLAKPTTTTTIDLAYSYTKSRVGVDQVMFTHNYTIAGPQQFTVNFPYQDTYDTTISTYVAKIDQVTSIGTLTSVSQYAYNLGILDGSVTWLPNVYKFGVHYPTRIKAFNEDLHLASSPDADIQWIVGGFYQLRQTVGNLNVYWAPGPGGTNNTFCNCTGGPAAVASLSYDHNNGLSWAPYAQASVPLPANLKLAVAVRYDVDKLTDQDVKIAPGPNNAIEQTFEAFQPSGTLSEQFTTDLMGYVTFGKGFQAGGFNPYKDVLNSGGFVPRKFPSTVATNYEAGIKSEFLNHRLRLNADVFHTDVKNEHYYLFLSNPVARDILTIGSVSFNGGELEMTYIPVDGLTLNGGLAVADSTITSNDPNQNDLHKQSPQAPSYTVNFAAQYVQPLSGNYDALYRLDYNYKGAICYDPANIYCYHGVSLLDARVALESDRYTFALWGKNILNVRYPTGFLPNAAGPGVSEQNESEPATYGVEVTAHF